MVEQIEHKQITALIYAKELKLNVVQVQQWLTDISATRAAEGFDDGFENAEASANKFYELAEEIKNIDINNLTPIQALTVISMLKDKVKSYFD